MNLYPVAFKDTNPGKWVSGFFDTTGFEKKSEYIEWCKKFRFPQMRNWASIFSPELIICLGKSYIEDFSAAFLDCDVVLHTEQIEDRELSWGVNSNGTLVVILPFMVNRNGLVRNHTIQLVGERIAELLDSQGSCIPAVIN